MYVYWEFEAGFYEITKCLKFMEETTVVYDNADNELLRNITCMRNY